MRAAIRFAVAVATFSALGFAGPAQADEAAFFTGKTVQIIVGSSAGGSSAAIAQILSDHIGRHIPGNPTVIAQFMPGAGGMRAMNFVYNAAAQDGTVMGVMLPTALTAQLLYPGQANYDIARINWLGRIIDYTSVLSVLKGAPAETLEEAARTELIIGATGRGSPAYQEPALAGSLLGLNLKIVTGYSGGAEVTLAMERGEVHGRVMSTNGWEMQRPDWVEAKRLVHLVQIGPGDPKRMPGVPRLYDLVKTDRERAVARFAEIAPRTGWGAYLPPEVPAERVAALRQAFKATLADPAFVEQIERVIKIEVSPMLWDAFEPFVQEVLATPPDVLAEVKRIYGIEQ